MAVDTRDKRSSAIGSRRLPWLRRFTLPLADGTMSAGDRQQTAFVYRGVLAGEAAGNVLFDRWADVIRLNTDPWGRSEVTVDEGRLG